MPPPANDGPVLVLVSEDPETSHRANEAIRIALGVLAGENEVTLVLTGPAVKVLDGELEDYADGEDLHRHLTTLKKLGLPFHVDAGDGLRRAENPLGLELRPVDRSTLARLIAASRRVLVF